MWAAIIEFVLGLFGFVPKGPSTAEQLGQQETVVKDDAVVITNQQKAGAAEAAAYAAAVADPASVRAPDSDSRD
jgi:hypothetical protein